MYFVVIALCDVLPPAYSISTPCCPRVHKGVRSNRQVAPPDFWKSASRAGDAHSEEGLSRCSALNGCVISMSAWRVGGGKNIEDI